MRPAARRLVVFILADGARPDVMRRLLEAGDLPQIEEHVVGPGSFLTLTTTLPSTTGPAYLPFLTGRFPGSLNVPGIRWLDKEAYLGRGPRRARMRSYCGPQVRLIGQDFPADCPTVFDLFERPFNVASFFSRGLPPGHDLVSKGRRTRYFYAHVAERWDVMDQASRRALLACLDADPDFVFCVFPGVDAASHYRHPEHPETVAAYRYLDDSIGLLVEQLRARGSWKETLLLVGADHGLSATSLHLDLARYLNRRGVKSLSYPLIFRRRPEMGVMISGNAAALLYWLGDNGCNGGAGRAMRRRMDFLWKELLQRPEVDLFVWREAAGRLRVESAAGAAELRGSWQEGLSYHPLDADPLQLGGSLGPLDSLEAFQRTAATAYPDSLVQLSQLFESPRAGDAVVTSPPGADLRRHFEWPEHRGSHGSLCREHMLVPLLVNQPDWGTEGDPSARTIDVLPSILAWAGKPNPYELPGRNLGPRL